MGTCYELICQTLRWMEELVCRLKLWRMELFKHMKVCQGVAGSHHTPPAEARIDILVLAHFGHHIKIYR